MGSAHPTSLPRLSAGQLSRATACSRHLAQLLDPERSRGGATDPSFRLWRAVHDALQDSHRLALDSGKALAEHLPRKAPEELGVEERLVFSQTLEHYEEAFGDDDAVLDVRAGETISRPSACGRYHLSAQANLLFRRPAAPLEVRRVKLRSQPVGVPKVQPSDVALVALLRPPNETSDVVAVIHTLWAGGQANVTTQTVSSHDVHELRTTLRDRVDAAYANPDRATPGWWCGTCPFLLRCPAIPQDSPEALLARWSEESAPLIAPAAWTLPEPDVNTDSYIDEDW